MPPNYTVNSCKDFDDVRLEIRQPLLVEAGVDYYLLMVIVPMVCQQSRSVRNKLTEVGGCKLVLNQRAFHLPFQWVYLGERVDVGHSENF